MSNKLFSAAQKQSKIETKQTPAASKAAATQRSKARRSYKTISPDTMTLNGAPALSSTGSKVLDLFSRGGSMRSASDSDKISLFLDAYKEEPSLALACIFYLRDILQGQGERDFFRTCLNSLVNKNKKIALGMLPLIPIYGRWDDVLYIYRGTKYYNDALIFYSNQLLDDLDVLNADDSNKVSISLAAKWAPSEKAGKKSRILWRDLVSKFDSPREYRKVLSKLRKHLNIVESLMCSKQWDKVDYSKVPSRASLIYRKAFSRHDKERYGEYIQSLLANPKEVKVNQIKAATLYPYDIVSKVMRGSEDNATLQALWNALPDYLNGMHTNAIAVVDVSGSMLVPVSSKTSVQCIDVAVSLGYYLADKATGIWKDSFITFSESPQFVTVSGNNLAARLNSIYKSKWGYNTDILKVFDKILSLAKSNKLSDCDLPETVFIISDMQFDEAALVSDRALQSIANKYETAGYTRPHIVFWNLNDHGNSPAQYGEYGVSLFSGFSANTFRAILGDDTTPEDTMRQVLEADRYNPIRELFV